MALHVLLVEDSPTQAEFYEMTLMEMGLEVSVASDGKTALKMAAMDQPDVIILDVNLPGGMDGFQVCSRLARIPETQGIPVIMLTQLDTPEDALEGRKAGALDYIPKDEFAVETLLTSLRQFRILP